MVGQGRAVGVLEAHVVAVDIGLGEDEVVGVQAHEYGDIRHTARYVGPGGRGVELDPRGVGPSRILLAAAGAAGSAKPGEAVW